jgi:hypothetical protein
MLSTTMPGPKANFVVFVILQIMPKQPTNENRARKVTQTPLPSRASENRRKPVELQDQPAATKVQPLMASEADQFKRSTGVVSHSIVLKDVNAMVLISDEYISSIVDQNILGLCH